MKDLPFTNLQDLNLDWIIQAVRNLEQRVNFLDITSNGAFYAVYNVTDYDTIKSALDDNRAVFAKRGTFSNVFYVLSQSVLSGFDIWGDYVGFEFVNIDAYNPNNMKIKVLTCRKYSNNTTRWEYVEHSLT